MGLASSQARLLLLTARKSDLEFRAQQITNSEMILAMKTEEVAKEYSRKLSNQTLKFIDQSSQKELDIKASTLGTLSANGVPMKLRVFNGGDWHDWSDNDQTINVYKDANGKEISQDEYNALDDSAKGTIESRTIPGGNDYNGAEILAGINAGTMQIVYADGTKANEDIDPINGNLFSVAYNTSDDQAADAEYRSKTASIQIKEKRLQMDLNQVETQQKACETEIDSVKKVMDKNIDRSFKVFS